MSRHQHGAAWAGTWSFASIAQGPGHGRRATRRAGVLHQAAADPRRGLLLADAGVEPRRPHLRLRVQPRRLPRRQPPPAHPLEHAPSWASPTKSIRVPDTSSTAAALSKGIPVGALVRVELQPLGRRRPIHQRELFGITRWAKQMDARSRDRQSDHVFLGVQIGNVEDGQPVSELRAVAAQQPICRLHVAHRVQGQRIRSTYRPRSH